jgi:hypothetical protein
MYAALHGIPPGSPISLDEADDLTEIMQVGRSWQAAKQRNLEDARENDREERARTNKVGRSTSVDEVLAKGGE